MRQVAENAEFSRRQLNRAFVLMQYFGYLQRNPDDAPEAGLNFDGFNFWLTKLDQHNGNFIQAEMVKAFINSGEYRARFGLYLALSERLPNVSGTCYRLSRLKYSS